MEVLEGLMVKRRLKAKRDPERKIFLGLNVAVKHFRHKLLNVEGASK